ncbi:MAG: hypothetical protein R3282_00320, partial [Rhodothermales bacterium]|nr:hypothetical protein [Rhodothermales bacterium]
LALLGFGFHAVTPQSVTLMVIVRGIPAFVFAVPLEAAPLLDPTALGAAVGALIAFLAHTRLESRLPAGSRRHATIGEQEEQEEPTGVECVMNDEQGRTKRCRR